MLFYRIVLIGNIIVACLTAMVPLLAVVYFKFGITSFLPDSEFDPYSWIADIDFRVIYLIVLFAFIQNLAREIIKDAQDVKGDELIFVKSLPMVIGQWNALRLVSLLLILLPAFYCWIFIDNLNTLINDSSFITATIPFALAAFINLVVIVLIYSEKRKRLKLYDILLKVSMLLGITATFYLTYIHS